MASFETLQDRLAALQETTAQLQGLIERLATIKFEPGSVPLSLSTLSTNSSISSTAGDAQGDEEPNVATELSGEISQILREEEEELELLKEEISDLRTGKPGSDAEHHKKRLKEGLGRLEAVLKESRTSFRKAQISARRNLEEAQKLERQALFASYTASVLPSSTTTGNNTSPKPTHTELFSARDRRRMREKEKLGARDVVSASSDVTDALRRTHALIAGEVAKSAFATQTLAESTAALKELQQTYDGIDGMLAKSRDLVGALMTSQKSDTWYLRTSFYMLLCTLGWLVFRRFLYGPLWWVVWFPVRTTFRTGKAVSNLAGGGAGSGASMAVVDSAGKTKVVGIEEEGAVPTAKVGEEERKVDGSLVDELGRMVEDSLRGKVPEEVEEAVWNASGEVEGEPNPKKRMWEEPVAAEGEREG
ncbi:Sec20-domain-containing protein [Cercophora newfieldiana]|uniref:Sec20-domain-containing protein n=1 Tax=Cercophora newfieldiana TaxID=92897 RepID=A0AA39YS52_9PEZI|nr:Sec20-domain-containing protein [Cercophora newfieldiana]